MQPHCYFPYLTVGRFIPVLAIFLLNFSASTRMVSEHFLRNFPPTLLPDTFSKATFGNGIIAIVGTIWFHDPKNPFPFNNNQPTQFFNKLASLRLGLPIGVATLPPSCVLYSFCVLIRFWFQLSGTFFLFSIAFKRRGRHKLSVNIIWGKYS